MAGEAYLLSGDQLATFNNAHMRYPDGEPTIELHGVKALGDADSRFFLVRTQGEGDEITNGQFWTVHAAVSDGKGGLKPADKPVFEPNYATPDAYENTAGGDDHQIFGLFGGTKFVVSLDGFEKNKFYASRDQQAKSGDRDGEMDLKELEAANPDHVVCFARGTRLATETGEIAVEQLKIGDRVITADHGPREVRWIGCSRLTLGDTNRHLQPVCIRAGALGPGLPERDVTVSPAHRVLLQGAGCQLLLGEDEVLVPARFLVNGVTVTREDSARVEYWHVMFDAHEIVYTAGLASESFHFGDYALTALGRAAQSELRQLFPAFPDCFPGATGQTARPTARAFEARMLTGAAQQALAGAGEIL